MKNEIFYVLLNEYADHEPAFLAAAINCDERAVRTNPKYINKVVAPTLGKVRSCSGFHTVPDYSFDSMPEEYVKELLLLLENDPPEYIEMFYRFQKEGLVKMCQAQNEHP